MQHGYVFTIDPEFFGILLFTKPFFMCRCIKGANTVEEACINLGGKFAGNFKPANATAEACARRLMKRQDWVVRAD